MYLDTLHYSIAFLQIFQAQVLVKCLIPSWHYTPLAVVVSEKTENNSLKRDAMYLWSWDTCLEILNDLYTVKKLTSGKSLVSVMY